MLVQRHLIASGSPLLQVTFDASVIDIMNPQRMGVLSRPTVAGGCCTATPSIWPQVRAG
ncbi:hypothetical protein ACYJW8_11005 [Frateuria aurantia]